MLIAQEHASDLSADALHVVWEHGLRPAFNFAGRYRGHQVRTFTESWRVAAKDAAAGCSAICGLPQLSATTRQQIVAYLDDAVNKVRTDWMTAICAPTLDSANVDGDALAVAARDATVSDDPERLTEVAAFAFADSHRRRQILLALLENRHLPLALVTEIAERIRFDGRTKLLVEERSKEGDYDFVVAVTAGAYMLLDEETLALAENPDQMLEDILTARREIGCYCHMYLDCIGEVTSQRIRLFTPDEMVSLSGTHPGLAALTELLGSVEDDALAVVGSLWSDWTGTIGELLDTAAATS